MSPIVETEAGKVKLRVRDGVRELRYLGSWGEVSVLRERKRKKKK